jgi:hypothetical protein
LKLHGDQIVALPSLARFDVALWLPTIKKRRKNALLASLVERTNSRVFDASATSKLARRVRVWGRRRSHLTHP